MEVSTKLRITSKEFFINEEKGIVTCKIGVIKPFEFCQCGCDSEFIIGQAKLFPGDVWDVEVGKMIAERKAIIKGLKFMMNEIHEKKRKLAQRFLTLDEAEEVLQDKWVNAKIDLMHRTGVFERMSFIESGELWKMLDDQTVNLSVASEE